jgi:hypothetical protein
MSTGSASSVSGLIQANQRLGPGAAGPAKAGSALAAGLLRCRRCAGRLTVHYTGSHHDVARYVCHRGWLDKGEPRCSGFGGSRVDAPLVAEVLRVVQPAAVEAAILAHREEAKKQDEVRSALERELEVARYAASRAQRQYDATDPEEPTRRRRTRAAMEPGPRAGARDRAAHRAAYRVAA